MKSVNLFVVAGALAFATPAVAGGAHHHFPHVHSHKIVITHAHKHHCCGHHHSKKYYRKKHGHWRMETSVARAGLGGDSTLRANQENRSPLDVIYIYKGH
ncbi:MAG: hypothetical protein AAF318_14450 [Pseudomonadota bacterium]